MRARLGRRGYTVALAEAGRELGGRVTRESRLPGLAAWARVRDYRLQQLKQMPTVESFLDSRLGADDVLEYGFRHVVIATGAQWRRDGTARFHHTPIPIADDAELLTPDDLMAGKRPSGGHVVLYDDDHYYMGSVLAELLVAEGRRVTFVTPSGEVANWARNTLEQEKIQTRLLQLGVDIRAHHALTRVNRGGVEIACVFTGKPSSITGDSVLLVTARDPRDALYLDLQARRSDWVAAGITSVKLIGDANAPGLIAAPSMRATAMRRNWMRPTSATPCPSSATSRNCRLCRTWTHEGAVSAVIRRLPLRTTACTHLRAA